MEQRLIDANALWEFMRTYDDYQGAKEAHDLELIHRDSILFAIESAPTVVAVQVVRCKDCRWACLAPQRQTATCMKKRLPFTHDYDYFCADGERKVDADHVLED